MLKLLRIWKYNKNTLLKEMERMSKLKALRSINLIAAWISQRTQEQYYDREELKKVSEALIYLRQLNR